MAPHERHPQQRSKAKGEPCISVNETATWPARIHAERVYRIGILGFWNTRPSVLRGVLDEAFERIFADHPGPRLALLSGAIYRGSGWPTSTEEVIQAAACHQASVLFEAATHTGDWAYCACTPSAGLLPVRLYQRLVDRRGQQEHPGLQGPEAGAVPPKRISELIAQFGPGGDHTVNLDGLPIGLLLCSESNVLVSEQADEHCASVYQEVEADLFPHVRLIFHGAQHLAANWSKLEPRLEYLSASHRFLLCASNGDRASWATSSLCAYYNGAKVADTQGRHPNCPVPAELITDSARQDRFQALRLDIPGSMLA